MAHIDLPAGLPGIRGPIEAYPRTGSILLELAEALLRGDDHPLTPGERELIAARVSHLNGCRFCDLSHGCFAAVQVEGGAATVDAVRADPQTAPISPRLKALVAIADEVQRGGGDVTEREVARARREGATDAEIHDTVLIAAAFCMYNRYVDGLATWAPEDPASYEAGARRIAAHGYAPGAS